MSSDIGEIIDGYRRIDNITDAALVQYRQAYGDVSKDDIFHYVYGVLHSPDYRAQFAADLKKILPRIPLVHTREDFDAFCRAGRELMDLHVNYESVAPYGELVISGDEPGGHLQDSDAYDWYRVEKMRYGGKARDKDLTTVIVNSRITVAGIPEQAHDYLLGARSGIDWILERYQIKKDKASGIVNDPNDWAREVGNPRYILDLLTRIVTVSVRTVDIVGDLPPLRVLGDPSSPDL